MTVLHAYLYHGQHRAQDVQWRLRARTACSPTVRHKYPTYAKTRATVAVLIVGGLAVFPAVALVGGPAPEAEAAVPAVISPAPVPPEVRQVGICTVPDTERLLTRGPVKTRPVGVRSVKTRKKGGDDE